MLYIRNLSQTNPTMLNGIPISGSLNRLREGDEIVIGETKIMVYIQDVMAGLYQNHEHSNETITL